MNKNITKELTAIFFLPAFLLAGVFIPDLLSTILFKFKTYYSTIEYVYFDQSHIMMIVFFIGIMTVVARDALFHIFHRFNWFTESLRKWIVNLLSIILAYIGTKIILFTYVATETLNVVEGTTTRTWIEFPALFSEGQGYNTVILIYNLLGAIPVAILMAWIVALGVNHLLKYKLSISLNKNIS